MEQIDAYEDWLIFKGIDLQEGINNVDNYVTAYARRWQNLASRKEPLTHYEAIFSHRK
jgi:hypothetical protein